MDPQPESFACFFYGEPVMQLRLLQLSVQLIMEYLIQEH